MPMTRSSTVLRAPAAVLATSVTDCPLARCSFAATPSPDVDAQASAAPQPPSVDHAAEVATSASFPGSTPSMATARSLWPLFSSP